MEANAVSKSAVHEKDRCSYTSNRLAKAIFEKLVRGENLTL